jgi:hypothetical protein
MARNFLTPFTVEGNGPNSLVYTYPGTLVVGTGKVGAPLPIRDLTITGWSIYVNTPSSGSSIICDVNLTGTTLFAVGKPTVGAGSQGASASLLTIPVTSGAANWITIDIDQVGSTTPGADLTITIWYA